MLRVCTNCPPPFRFTINTKQAEGVCALCILFLFRWVGCLPLINPNLTRNHLEHYSSWATPPVRLGISGRNSGKTPETLSESFLEFPSRVRLGCPKPYNSRHLRLPERFQNSLPPSTAGDASFFGIGSGEGLSELLSWNFQQYWGYF